MIACLSCPTPRRLFSSEETLAVHLIDDHGLEAPAAVVRARLIAKDDAKVERHRASKTKAHQPSAVSPPVKEEPPVDRDDSKRKCSACGGIGHRSNSRDCPSKAGTKGGGGGVPKPERASGKKRRPVTRRHPMKPRKVGTSRGAGSGMLADLEAFKTAVTALEPLDIERQVVVLVATCRFLGIDPKSIAA